MSTRTIEESLMEFRVLLKVLQNHPNTERCVYEYFDNLYENRLIIPDDAYGKRNGDYQEILTRYNKDICLRGDVHELATTIMLLHWGCYNIRIFSEKEKQLANVDMAATMFTGERIFVQSKSQKDRGNVIDVLIFGDWLKTNSEATHYVAAWITETFDVIKGAIYTSEYIRGFTSDLPEKRSKPSHNSKIYKLPVIQ